jgi:lysophospholipase L1-like esterase
VRTRMLRSDVVLTRCLRAVAGAVAVVTSVTLAICCEVRSRARSEPGAPRTIGAASPSDAAARPVPLPVDAGADTSAAASPGVSPCTRGPDGSRPAPSGAEHAARRVCSIAAIGDSLTDFSAHGGGYLRFLRERCPRSRIDNYGRGGDMVNQMRRRLFGQVLQSVKLRYTHVIVFGGVNDLYSDLTAGRTVEKISRDLRAMYRAAHDRGIQVVAVTVAPWGGFSRYYNARRGAATLALNDWIRRQPGDGTVDAVVDAYSLLSCGDPERICDGYGAPFRDGLHFGPAGHRVLAQALFSRVFHECL